jgi:hypothetical protein
MLNAAVSGTYLEDPLEKAKASGSYEVKILIRLSDIPKFYERF